MRSIILPIILAAGGRASADTPVQMGGYLQTDAVPWTQDSENAVDSAGKPLNQERVLIRRARLRAESHQGYMSGALEFDGNTINGATARLLSAYARVSYPQKGKPLVAATFGVFKTPFGTEVPTSDRDKPFLESPAFARALFAGNYDGGLMVNGQYNIARWVVAATNGAPSGDTQWKGVDPSSSLDFLGRIGVDVAGPYRSRFLAGVSALRGHGLHAGKAATKDQLQWKDSNMDGMVELDELTVLPGTAATPSRSYSHQAFGFDAGVQWTACGVGKGTGFIEGVMSTNLDRGLVYADPIVARRDVRQWGMSIGATQDVGAYARVGARYDNYNADRDAPKRFSTFSVMATALWPGVDARFLAQYDHEKNPLGMTASGKLTTRPDDRITLRAQVGF